MSKDINIKYLEHPRYRSKAIEVSNEFEQILQRIELILYTQKGDVLGEEDFGASISDYLWSLNLNVKSIESSVKNELEKEIPKLEQYQFGVDVEKFDRETDSVGIITITLQDINQNPDYQTKLQAIFT